MSTRIELGDLVKDSITGVTGVAIAITTWLHGCRRVVVQPQELKDGKPVDNSTFDEPQLVLMKSRQYQDSHNTGGPRPDPVRPADTKRT